MKDKTYPYGYAFQLGVLALVAQDPGFRASFDDVVRPEYFETDILQCVCRLMTQVATRRQHLSKESLETEFIDYARKYGVKDDFRENVLSHINKIFHLNIEHLDYISERVVHFARRQCVADALVEMVNVVDRDGELEDCRRVLDKALQVGATRDLGIDFSDAVSNMEEIFANSSMDPSRKIPTNIPILDKAMRGGIGIGELGMVLGPTGRGKSIVLANLAAGALICQKKVVYITFELFEAEVFLRFLQKFTGCTDEEVMAGGSNFKTKIEAFVAQMQRRLKIKYFPPNTMSVSQLRAYLARLRAIEGWTPDLIILDDGDSLRPPKGMSHDYHGLGAIYTDIIGVLVDFEAACWAASQAQRIAFDADVVNLGHTSDSFKKAHRANAAIAVCQNDDEKKMNKCRLYMAKGRNCKDGFFIYCNLDKSRMHLEQSSTESQDPQFGQQPPPNEITQDAGSVDIDQAADLLGASASHQ